MESVGTSLVFIVILALLSSLFSATETAYSSASKIKLKNLARDGNKKAARVLDVVEDFDKFLTTILIGNNIVNIMLTTVSTLLFASLIGEKYGPTVSTVVITIIVLIFGEITPKTIARKIPIRFACATIGFVQFCEGVFLPLASVLGGFQTLVNNHIKVADDDSDISDELMTMVSEAEKEGNLMQGESDLISAAIDFRELCVEDILTPRVNVLGVDITTPVEEIAKIFRMNSFSRLPVYETSIDNIVGVIHQKDFYEQVMHDQAHLRKILQPALYTARGTHISVLLNQLQASKLHMAVVLDEYGGTEGIITLEDIVEELVGEIWDEHDIVEEYYQQLDSSTYLVECGAEVDDLFKRFALKDDDADDRDFVTVSGWVIHQFGYIPKAGESFDFQHLNVTVTQVDQRKVIQIRIEEHKQLTMSEDDAPENSDADRIADPDDAQTRRTDLAGRLERKADRLNERAEKLSKKASSMKTADAEDAKAEDTPAGDAKAEGNSITISTGRIPGLDHPVSRLFFGTASPPISTGGDGAFELLDGVLSCGINAFDCARSYGLAENTMGKWMQARGNRDQVTLLTKCGDITNGIVLVNRQVIAEQLERSLDALQTDTIDIYLLHRYDPNTPVEEIIDALNEHRENGKIRTFGVSNWPHECIAQANRYAASHHLEGFSVSSPNYGLARQIKDLWGGGCVTISGPENSEAREWYAKSQMPVIAYSSLGRGFFSGRFQSYDYDAARTVLDSYAQEGYLYEENMLRLKRAEELASKYGTTVPEIAMRYIFSSPMNVFAIVSSTSPGRLQMNIRAAAQPLSAEDAAFLEEN